MSKADGVHRPPITLVSKYRELSLARQLFEWLPLEYRIRSDEGKRFPAEHEEPAVDPTLVQLRFLAELLHQIAAKRELAESAGRISMWKAARSAVPTADA